MDHYHPGTQDTIAQVDIYRLLGEGIRAPLVGK